MNWHGQYVRCEEELRKIKSEINDTRVEGVNDAKRILRLKESITHYENLITQETTKVTTANQTWLESNTTYTNLLH